MALDPVKNFAKATVSTGYDASETSIVLTSGHGAKFPQPSTDGAFNVTWWNSTDYPDPSDDPNVEIVRVTARSTDTLTVTRAQESTSGSTKNTAGKTYKMILGPTSKTITDVAASVQKTVSQSSHGFVVGDVIKSSGTANQYAKAQADSSANAAVVGIVTSVPDADNFKFTSNGEVTSGVPAVAAGTILFLSPTVAGGLTSTEPTGAGQVSRPVAIVVENAARMFFYAQTIKTRSVVDGGTGASSLTANGVVVGNGTQAVQVTGTGTSGQVLTSNGAGSAPTFQTPSGGAGSATITVAKAGEALSIRDAITLLNDCEQGMRSNRTDDSSERMGDGTRQQQACRIIPRENVTSSQIYLRIAKHASPTDNVKIEIQSDSAGSPSGTPITNGTSNNVAGSGLAQRTTGGNIYAAYAQQLFTFASAFSLTAGTTYWIVFKRDGAQSGTNFYAIDNHPDGEYASFQARYYTGASWSSNNYPFYFLMVPSSGSLPIRAWKSKNNNVSLSRVDGFATAATSLGDTFTYQNGGEMSGFSGMTPGVSQFPSGTAGTLQETQSTYGGVVGRAISSSVLAIELKNEAILYNKTMRYHTSIPTTLFIPCGFRIKRMMAMSPFSEAGGRMSIGVSRGSNQFTYYFDSTGTANATSDTSTSYISDNGQIAFQVSSVTEYGVELASGTSTNATGGRTQLFEAII